MWDVASGRSVRDFLLPEGKWAVLSRDGRENLSFTPDGKSIFLWTPGARGSELWSVLTAWDAADGRCLTQRLAPRAVAGALSPDGESVVALECDGFLRLRSRDTDRTRLEFQFERSRVEFHYPPGVGGRVRSLAACDLAISPDGHLVAARSRYRVSSGREESNPLRLGGMATGRQLAVWPIEGPAVLAFSADGSLLAVADRYTIRLRETASWKDVGSIAVPTGGPVSPDRPRIGALAFSTDGRTLATGHADGTILLWDATFGAGSPGPATRRVRIESLWADLANPDAARANAAVWQLVGDRERSVPFLTERLGAARAPKADDVHSLLRDLDSDSFKTREAAERKLRDLGDRAEAPLRAALSGEPSPETKRRVQEVLASLDPASLQTSERLRELRSVAVLERTGAPEARQALEQLAKHAGSPRLAQAARDALRRMGRS
jgi:hypothetical protein